MENKEFLSEENYLRGKKKLTKIAIIIFSVGLLIGCSLIVTGIVKTKSAQKANEKIANSDVVVARSESEIQKDIEATKNNVDVLTTQITALEREKTRLFQESGFSDSYYAKEDEITAKQKEKSNLQAQLLKYESELWKVQSGYNGSKNEFKKNMNKVSTSKYTFFYIIGSFIIIFSGMISLSIYFVSKRREITAFTVQQFMPIAQEGMEKMAPSVANVKKTIAKEMAPVYGEIAKEITKGIKDAQTEDKK